MSDEEDAADDSSGGGRERTGKRGEEDNVEGKYGGRVKGWKSTSGSRVTKDIFSDNGKKRRKGRKARKINVSG